jgi:hypothetical protein
MKRTLNLIMTLALTLTTWSLRAAINPNILTVNVNIDGIPDTIAEENPGGYVAVGGTRKKVKFKGTLDPAAPNPKVRVSWVSGKIELQKLDGTSVSPDGPTGWTNGDTVYKDSTVTPSFSFEYYVTGQYCPKDFTANSP